MVSTPPELPTDVLRTIFERLPQPDILAAAAVSRAWRGSAVLDPAYYRPWSYFFDPLGVDNNGAMIDGLEDVVYDAEQLRYRLKLAVVVKSSGGRIGRPETMSANPDDNACALLRAQVLPLLRRAVPLLVGLNVLVEPVLAPVLWAALNVPAPHLRTLKMDFAFGFDLEGGGMPVLPADIFAGSAPVLLTVDFNGITLLCTPAPCFKNVRTLEVYLAYSPGRLSAVARCFPRVENLRIHSIAGYTPTTGTNPLTPGDIASFEPLRSLYLGPATYFDVVSAALVACAPGIPHLDIHSEDVDHDLAEILGQPAPQHLELHEGVVEDQWVPFEQVNHHRQLRLRLSSASTVRCIDSNTGNRTVFKILRLSGAAATLTDIAIDDRFIWSLLRACPALPALQRLSVVLVWWAHTAPLENDELPPAPPAASCPRLTTLTLHATHPDAVVPEEALRELARAFGAPHLVLANGATADAGGAFATAVTQFKETAHAQRAQHLRARAAASGLSCAGILDSGRDVECAYYVRPPAPAGSA